MRGHRRGRGVYSGLEVCVVPGIGKGQAGPQPGGTGQAVSGLGCQVNPVRKGAQARRKAARQEQERRNAYFRQTAIDRAIEREKEKAARREAKD